MWQLAQAPRIGHTKRHPNKSYHGHHQQRGGECRRRIRNTPTGQGYIREGRRMSTFRRDHDTRSLPPLSLRGITPADHFDSSSSRENRPQKKNNEEEHQQVDFGLQKQNDNVVSISCPAHAQITFLGDREDITAKRSFRKRSQASCP